MRTSPLLRTLLAVTALGASTASCWDRTVPTTDPLPNPIDDPTPIIEAGRAAGVAFADAAR